MPTRVTFPGDDFVRGGAVTYQTSRGPVTLCQQCISDADIRDRFGELGSHRLAHRDRCDGCADLPRASVYHSAYGEGR